MKKFIIIILMWLSATVIILPQTLVWEKQIDHNKPFSKNGLEMNSNKKTIMYYWENSTVPSSKLVMLENNVIIWEKTLSSLISGIRTHPTNGSFYITTRDSVFQFDESGNVIYSLKISSSTSKNFTIIGGDDERYIIVDNNTNTMMIFDYNNSLISTHEIDKKIVEKISINQNKICISSWNYGGGSSTSVHSYLAIYSINGEKEWNDSIPDANNLYAVIQNNEIYSAACVYDFFLPIPTMTWIIKKFSDNGQLIWERIWDGDNNGTLGNWLNNIIALPNGGCVISGSRTRVSQPDPNSYGGVIKAYSKEGDSLWRIDKDNSSSSCTFIESMCWDKNKALLAIYIQVPKAGTDISFNLTNYFIPGITPVNSENPEIPNDFTLHQNYPNPFNPSTTITFTLLNRTHVSLKIYDLLGKEVAELVNEELNPGTYEKIWSAENLASGEYFYRLECGNLISTKKMIFLK